MSSARYWVALLIFAFPAFASSAGPAPVPNDLIQRIQSIKSLHFIRSIPLAGLGTETFHPQGLKIVGSELYLTTVDGRSKGHGYLLHFHFDDPYEPTRIIYKDRVQFDAGSEGRMNHAGGMDLDGDSLVIPLAVYDSKGPSRILRVPLDRINDAQTIATVKDHVGAITAFADSLYGFNWDAKEVYRESTSGFEPILRGDGWAYQDCKSIVSPYALCSALHGLFNLSGAVRLIDLNGSNGRVSALWCLPVSGVRPDGSSGGLTSLAQNAFDFEVQSGSDGSVNDIRFYFVPHDGEKTSLLIYSAQ